MSGTWDPVLLRRERPRVMVGVLSVAAVTGLIYPLKHVAPVHDRHAAAGGLARLLKSERFDRVIISAAEDRGLGISGEDILWVIKNAQAEVLILRPAPEDTRTITATGLSGHF